MELTPTQSAQDFHFSAPVGAAQAGQILTSRAGARAAAAATVAPDTGVTAATRSG